MTGIKDIKKLIDKIPNEVNKGINKISEVEKKAVNEISKNATKITKQSTDEIVSAGKIAKKVLSEDAKKLGEQTLKDIQHGLETAAKGIYAGITSDMFNTFIDLAQYAIPGKLPTIQLGPFEIKVKNLNKRIDELQRMAKNPPTSRDDIIKLIKVLSPDEVIIHVSARAVALVVSSNVLGGGFKIAIPVQTLEDKAAEIFAHFGL